MLPPSPRTAWRQTTEAELSIAPADETEPERKDRLEELEWVRSGMTQVDLTYKKAYRRAVRDAIGAPSQACVDGGVAEGRQGWHVIEDGCSDKKMM